MTKGLTFALALLCAGLVAGCAAARIHPAEMGPELKPIDAPTPDEIRAAIDRGVAFLIEHQNPGGSWGTIRHKDFNIVMPVPAGHHSTRVATTCLCVMALIEAGGGQPGADEALQRGEDWLLDNIPKIRIPSRYVMYNNWAHAYVLQALVHMLTYRPLDDDRRQQVRALIQDQIDRLERYQHLDGGWGYYAGGITRSAGSMSFMTATVLVGLHDAQQAGFRVPEKMVERAMQSIRAQRRPDFAYAYAFGGRKYPMSGINKTQGSLARSQVCNAAMYLWGDEDTTLPIIESWLRRIIVQNFWLSNIRKRNYTHQGPFDIAPYFYYYGHYYAARGIELVPAADRPPFQEHLARILIDRQDQDGSWWDYALYNYQQFYGTGFVVLSLNRCLESPVTFTFDEEE